MKQMVVWTSIMGLCVAAIGCGSDDKEEEKTANKSIAFVTGRPGSDDPFMASMTSGAESKATALGVELLVRPSPDWNPVAQTPVVEALIKEKVGAIVIQPTSTVDADMIAPLRKAFDAGIIVITVDTFIGTNTYGKGGAADFPISFIGSNNKEGGQIGCDGLAAAVGDAGKVLVVGAGSTTNSVVDRETGCRANLTENHPGVVMVNPGGELQGELTAKEWAKQLAIQYMTSDPDLKGVFTTAFDVSQGATEAVLEAGKETTIRVIVFDCDASAAERIRAGTLYGCVAQKPAMMGATGVEFARNALKGVTGIPAYVSTGFVVLNQENIDNPEMSQFVYGATL